VTGKLPISPLSLLPELQEHQLILGFAILSDQPFLRIALLNPRQKEAIEKILHPWILNTSVQWWAVTPQTLKNLFQGQYSSAEAPYDLYLHSPFPEQFLYWTRKPESDHGVVFETATHLWVLSPHSSEFISPKIRERYGKTLHLFTVSDFEWQRLQTLPLLNSTSETKLSAPVVDAWSVDWGERRVEREFLDDLLQQAIERGASDIHLEPKRDYVRVRFRIHGELVVQPPIPLNRYPLVLRRAKVLSGMRPDLAPCNQDGAADRSLQGKRYDQRYSILLLKEDQECLVIRIFGSQLPTLDELNLGTKERETLDWFLGLESGMLVTSGPTGSGKTTTLYACLSALDSPQRRIVTVEHPVEKYFENATQVDIREGKLTFPNALRTVLRQDPDVIMVGEMRDSESAEMAVHAALTGHLVLTTTHALDSVGVLERMGGSFKLDRVALGYSLKLSVAQRLVSVLCPHCKKERPPHTLEIKRLGLPQVTSPLVCERVGCLECHGTGIQGRRVIMEMMPVDDEIIDRLESKATLREIRQWNRSRGFRSIQDQVIDLFYSGIVESSEALSFRTTLEI
ncbi:MAG: ATPase, T2SS/T4P/T4SS family, partial [Verrucomicrobiota bacterium]